MVPFDKKDRLNYVIEMAWEILFEQIKSNRLSINKEASLQLHFSKLIYDIGNLYCISPKEFFTIEMESDYEAKNIDIICGFEDLIEKKSSRAAIELKCFMKESKRARETDSYNSLKDVERLQNYKGFEVKKFICLTNDKYYPQTEPKGNGKTVSIKNGTFYSANAPIVPAWEWSRTKSEPINFNQDVRCEWIENEPWHYLKISVL